MKNAITFKVLLLCLIVNTVNAQRYLTEVFEEVEVTTGVTYGENITVMTVPATGMPSSQELKMDVYYPANDTEIDRPLLINVHHGNFLPIVTNTIPVGERKDSFQVESAMRLAKMGYVVANIDYRFGWNPLSPNIEDRESGYLNALYRAMQDVKTCARFFRKEVVENGNAYGICPEKIGILGNGTGGYIALASGLVNSLDEFLLNVDTPPNSPPYISENVNGNAEATTDGFGEFQGQLVQFCQANHVGYSSDLSLIVNLGGGVRNLDWIDSEDPPIVSFQVTTDPITPFEEGFSVGIINCDLLFEVGGALAIHNRPATQQINQVFEAANINDEFTTAANTSNSGLEGLFPLHRPCPISFFPPNEQKCESAPWEWWDIDFWSQQEHPNCQATGLPIEECNFHLINSNNNQDVSAEKGRIYIDTIMGYFAPRAYAALNLGSENCMVTTQELLEEGEISLEIAPNPAHSEMQFLSDENEIIEKVEIYNLSGQLVDYQIINSNSFLLKKERFSKGIFIAKVQFEKGIVAKKIVFE